ncbi:hypothetical protein ACN38_g9634 [Penicillium nordicum]|uniref:Uncharacterized protein n=1 Tax=Penicillium nordicum TaxID=229535 RepID=A0A0M9WCD8_9EURO|nr:hypothetical protein ACN38_g9634 [Penicillium nordicum]
MINSDEMSTCRSREIQHMLPTPKSNSINKKVNHGIHSYTLLLMTWYIYKRNTIKYRQISSILSISSNMNLQKSNSECRDGR